MKAVCKKLFSLMLVAILLVSAVPFQASAEEVNETVATEATEATTAATEAAVVTASEGEANAEIEANSPAAQGEVVPTDRVYVEFEIAIGGEDNTWRIGDVVKTKIGSTVSFPSESAVLKVWKAVTGSSEGYGLVRWELEEGVKFSGVVSVEAVKEYGEEDAWPVENPEYPLLQVKAVVELVEKQVTLDPAKGTVSPSKINVILGGQYPKLPTPTRKGYNFVGWFKDGIEIVAGDEVKDLGKLTAEWSAEQPTVIFQRYEGTEGYAAEAWNTAPGATFKVDMNSVLKTDYSNFPTEAQIKKLFKIEGWDITGWEYSADKGDTWATFTAGKTKITADTIIRPVYTKKIDLDPCDKGQTYREDYLTVTLGKRFPSLPHPGTREGYAFIGWYLNADATGEVSTKANLSNVAKHAYVPVEIEKLYAGWAEAMMVKLYIYTNGNTTEAKVYEYYDVPTTGLDLDAIDLADIFANYGKYDDSGDEKYGWFTNTQWSNYRQGKHKYDSTSYATAELLESEDGREFHLMLIDNGNNASSGGSNGNSYNDNKSTVDSSNPTTGDEIFVAVTIMAVSACAALLIFLNKKRIFK